jgi:hypothetical protein
MRFTMGTAFAGVTAGMLALFGITASADASPAKHSHTSDCKRVAARDYALCRRVQLQHAYGVVNPDGSSVSTPNGRVIVHEITHDGLPTDAEMRAGLQGAALDYRAAVTAVTVNMDAMVRKCGNPDGRWVVQYRDEDGKPGGVTLTLKRIVCA